MADLPKDELAWLNDPSLDEGARWAAFKAWEARQRRTFAQSNEAREEFRAWLASEPDHRVEAAQPATLRHRKVFRLT